MHIKLKQLPDREMKRLTISVSPDVFSDLEAYADTYGKEEQPSALIPSMVEAFLASDSGFRRAQKERQHSS